MIERIFWASVAWQVYVYAGYPLLALLVGRMSDRIVRRAPWQPRVTVVIAAYNEAKHIVDTVRNKLNQSYPEHLLDVIVVSDESSDGTDELVRAIGSPRVSLIRQEPRQGKTAGLNRAVPAASGDIVVFSDANSIFGPDAVARLVENFADRQVGYVTGKMIYTNPDGSVVGDGCTAYMRYENWLRDVETRLGSVVGVDGGVDAVRKDLYKPMRADQLPDFVLPLSVVEQRFRVVYDPRALLQENALSESSDEFRMRVRVSLRAIWALWDKRGLLLPLPDPVFAWQLWSHKVLRYFAFVALIGSTLTSVLLATSAPIYALALAAHAALFAFAVIGLGAKLTNPPAAVRLSSYFVLINAAAGLAAFRFLRGEKQVIWQPRAG